MLFLGQGHMATFQRVDWFQSWADLGRVPQHAFHLEESWLSHAPASAAFRGSCPGSPSLCHLSQNAMSREMGVGTEA